MKTSPAAQRICMHGFFIFLALALASGGVGAAEYTWVGQGLSNDWADERNWNPAGVPATGDSATIDREVEVDLDGPRTVGLLSLRNGASIVNRGRGALTVGDGADSAAAGIVTLSGDGVSIATPLVFGGEGTESAALFLVEGSEGDRITISGPVDIGWLTQPQPKLVLQEHENAAHVVFSGRISGSSGETDLQIRPGNGAVTLAGENEFTGERKVLGLHATERWTTATVYLANSMALGDAETLLRLSHGGTLRSAHERVIRVLISEPDVFIENEVTVGLGATTEIGGSNESGTVVWTGDFTFVRQPEPLPPPGIPVRLVAAEGGTVEFQSRIGDAAQGISVPVEKTGKGTVALNRSGGVPYQGPTTVKEGVLLVFNTSGSGTGLGPVFVESGAVLGGTGRIAPTMGEARVTVQEGGVLMAGDGVHAEGSLFIDSDLSLYSGSVLQVLLGPPGVSSALVRTADAVWSFADGQQVEVLLQEGASPGTYPAIISGLDGDPGVDSWTVSTPGYENSRFTYDGNGNVDLLLAR